MEDGVYWLLMNLANTEGVQPLPLHFFVYAKGIKKILKTKKIKIKIRVSKLDRAAAYNKKRQHKLPLK